MKITKPTSQPIGHYNYCKKHQSDCRSKRGKISVVKLSKSKWNDLVAINTQVNHALKPVTDYDAHGVEELWSYPQSVGDCEDYVLWKRKMLMDKGWPVSALLITVVKQPNGDGHAVLTVHTDLADYILDNLRDEIRPWNETEYTYLKRQNRRNAGKWVDIRDDRPQATLQTAAAE